MIKIVNVSKSFDDLKLFENYNAEIPEKGVTVFMGRSGSGKTTLLNMLIGVLEPDSGRIDGMSDKKLSCVFQDDRLLEWGTPLSNMRFVMDPYDDKKAIDILKRLGLAGNENKSITELSGGMKRRVALARALCVDPNVLILDEPFKGLDDEIKEDIMKMIKDMSRKIAIIVVTHEQTEADYLADMIYQI